MLTQRIHSADFAVAHQARGSFLFSRSPRFTVWGLGGMMLLLVGCQPAPQPLPAPDSPSPSVSETPIAASPGDNPPIASPSVKDPSAANPSTANPATANPSVANPSAAKQYENQQVGFHFAYPSDFVIDHSVSHADNQLQTIELWQQEIQKAIVAGKYEGGTEYPPNVQVRIGRNPDRLFLKDWVERQSEKFSSPKSFEEYSIAGQNGLSFRSTGLYEQENVVVASPDMQTVIVISLGTIGVPMMDDPNRRAFTQIVDSFQIGSANP